MTSHELKVRRQPSSPLPQTRAPRSAARTTPPTHRHRISERTRPRPIFVAPNKNRRKKFLELDTNPRIRQHRFLRLRRIAEQIEQRLIVGIRTQCMREDILEMLRLRPARQRRPVAQHMHAIGEPPRGFAQRARAPRAVAIADDQVERSEFLARCAISLRDNRWPDRRRARNRRRARHATACHAAAVRRARW